MQALAVVQVLLAQTAILIYTSVLLVCITMPLSLLISLMAQKPSTVPSCASVVALHQIQFQ